MPRTARWVACWDLVDLEPAAEVHQANLELWAEYAPRLRAMGYVPAFVCGQGATPDSLPEDATVLFLGGDDAWKEGPAAEAITRRHAQAGGWVHMGRVNTRRRILLATAWGCRSGDGTTLGRGPDRNLPPMLRWLAEVNHPQLHLP